MSRKILVIDDDPVHRGHIERILAQLGYQTFCVASGEEGIMMLLGPTNPGFDAVLLDLIMPDLDGMAVLTRLRRTDLRVPVIVLVKASALDLAMNAISAGAQDFAVIPVGKERLTVALASAFKFSALQSLAIERDLEAGLLPESGDLDLIDPELKRLLNRKDAIKASNLPLLIEGEVGSGRTILARAIHRATSKQDKDLVTLSATTLNQENKTNTIHSALSTTRNSVVIVQECQNLNDQSQRALITALKARKRRNVPRLILTADGTLFDRVRSGAFLEDLFYRITLSTLRIRPLADRKIDLISLSEHEIKRYAALYGCGEVRLSEDAKSILPQASWALERRKRQFTLRSIVERTRRSIISAQDIIECEALRPFAQNQTIFGLSLVNDSGLLRSFADLERDIIEFALQRSGGRVANVAHELGIGRSTLYRKLESNGLVSNEVSSIVIGDAA